MGVWISSVGRRPQVTFTAETPSTTPCESHSRPRAPSHRMEVPLNVIETIAPSRRGLHGGATAPSPMRVAPGPCASEGDCRVGFLDAHAEVGSVGPVGVAGPEGLVVEVPPPPPRATNPPSKRRRKQAFGSAHAASWHGTDHAYVGPAQAPLSDLTPAYPAPLPEPPPSHRRLRQPESAPPTLALYASPRCLTR
jgi:hypothetical protein